MNQLYNPVFISKILKNYFFDIDRLNNINSRDLERFRDKRFRNIVKFAYTFPLYHDLYKKAGVHPEIIQGLKDIKKLPFVSKNELHSYYPDGLISSKTSENDLIKVSTSGTTGRSFSIFVDLQDIIIGLFGYIRMLREYDINWRKDKITIIGDFAPHTVESGYISKGLFAKMQNSYLFRNIQWLDTNEKPDLIIKKINSFKPDFLGAYTGMLGHLALLKEKGFGKNINPRVIATTGSVFDKSLRKYVNNVFDSELFETYASTEAGPIAFECRKGNYHILSDYVNLEILEKQNIGHSVITKLYGLGTPIIRYTAMNDIVELSSKKCNCGLSGSLLKKVYGRDILSLLLPDGKIMLSSSISQIFSRVLYELKTNIVIDLQIIQHDFENIEVKLVLDNKLKKNDSILGKISSIIVKGFHEKIGKNVTIKVINVKNIKKNEPRIISNIKKEGLNVKGYI